MLLKYLTPCSLSRRREGNRWGPQDYYFMTGFLFHDIIFGPVRSRRLGLSLGINLLPVHTKHCSFNCIYCECGWSPEEVDETTSFPSKELVRNYLGQRLRELAVEDYLPDSLTFAGNGEPTLHPNFESIIDDTLAVRDQYAPNAKVSVLSNASRISDPAVFRALLKVDNNILKLDAGSDHTFQLMNNPAETINYAELVENLCKFKGNLIIQSMFLRGSFKNQKVDNTTDEEVDEWLNHLSKIKPRMVMIYPIARATPVHNLEKIDNFTLDKIAEKVRALGIDAEVYE
jgi:wyosine [tRNA(Phe)-imidazoG37] synthetase (radical SAM superfamily)